MDCLGLNTYLDTLPSVGVPCGKAIFNMRQALSAAGVGYPDHPHNAICDTVIDIVG